MATTHAVPPGTPIMGVDVGNGYSKASILRVLNEDPVFLLPDALRSGMSSVAYVSPDGSIQVSGARNKKASRAVEAVKTYLHQESIELKDGGKTYRVAPQDVYAAIARDVVNLANQERKKRGEEPVHNLVLTYPASIRNSNPLLNKIKQSVEKVEFDGQHLNVCAMLSEPAAVAVDYLYFIRNLALNPVKATEYTVLVYDLGHGTFDAAIVTAYTDRNKDCDLFDQDGHPEVGGRKFDELLYNELLTQIPNREDEKDKKIPFSREGLRRLVVDMKHALSDPETTKVERSFDLDDGDSLVLRVTRERFESLISGQVNMTLEVVQNLLESAKDAGKNVDAIILSGGSGQIPMIRKALLELTENKLPVEVYRPSQAVTFGAARYAHDLYREEDNKQPVPPILTQHCERSSGIVIGNTVDFLLDEDAELPCRSEPFCFRAAASGRSEFVLRCASKRLKNAKQAAVTECPDEICRMYLNIPPNQQCQLVMSMDKNRLVALECTLPDGKVLRATAVDAKEA